MYFVLQKNILSILHLQFYLYVKNFTIKRNGISFPHVWFYMPEFPRINSSFGIIGFPFKINATRTRSGRVKFTLLCENVIQLRMDATKRQIVLVKYKKQC